MTVEELIGFFKNQDYKLAFQKLFLQDAFDRNEKPLNIDSIKEECYFEFYNLSLLQERLVLLPFKHWVEMNSSETLMPQNVCWISQVSPDIYPNQFVEMMNKTIRSIESQENQLVCFLETINVHGRVFFYFYSKEVNGIQQFNANIVLVDSDFDFLANDKGILNNTK